MNDTGKLGNLINLTIRKLWVVMLTHSRNMARYIHILTKEPTPATILEKKGALNLLLAICVATKHDLRNEKGYHYQDLRYLLSHVKEYRQGEHNQ